MDEQRKIGRGRDVLRPLLVPHIVYPPTSQVLIVLVLQFDSVKGRVWHWAIAEGQRPSCFKFPYRTCCTYATVEFFLPNAITRRSSGKEPASKSARTRLHRS